MAYSLSMPNVVVVFALRSTYQKRLRLFIRTYRRNRLTALAVQRPMHSSSIVCPLLASRPSFPNSLPLAVALRYPIDVIKMVTRGLKSPCPVAVRDVARPRSGGRNRLARRSGCFRLALLGPRRQINHSNIQAAMLSASLAVA